MGLNFTILNTKNFCTDTYIRIDLKYRLFADKLKFNVWNTDRVKPLSFFMIHIKSNILKKGDLDKIYNLIDLKSIGRRINRLSNIQKVENISSDKILLEYGDILIPKLEPKKGQFFLNLNHKQYLGSTELIEYRINKEFIKPKFLYYILVSNEMLKAFSYLESGKTHRRVQVIDLLKVKIPLIDLGIQNKVIEKIEPLEKQIQELKSHKKEHLEIINDVFSDEFNINLDEVQKLDNTRQFNLKLKDTVLKNDFLRISFKWHKLETIQSYMYEDIECIEKLSKFIINTKNGWSPESSEIEEGTPILGQEHILKDGKISLSASKFTTLTKSNIKDFYIKQNDFFVSRGNTVELVAMAGVVVDDIEDNIIYPDLYIKIDFDEECINKQYMAYLFNSFFGRIYFKHVSKGKNQTMVKISSKELYDFYLPVPTKDIQQELIIKIKTQIDNQKNIDKQIEEKQSEISFIIEDCIKAKSNYNT